MKSSRTLGLVMIAPAAIMIILFFLLPVVLTAVFSMTNMTTATGISGGVYQVAPNSLITLESSMPDIADQLGEPRYTIDEDGLKAVEALNLSSGIVSELREKHLKEVFPSRREIERMIKDLKDRPSTREVKQISDQFNRSVVNARFDRSRRRPSQRRPIPAGSGHRTISRAWPLRRIWPAFSSIPCSMSRWC
jgi:inositol-phosphate transport system permease protein